MRTSSEIRREFLQFFEERGHAIVPGAPLVPEDPTLLFTNAGMVQFKDVFLGKGTRPYARAADTQKCLRVSGKHNDLEEVGHDTTHHTFFEMLGNWSFGDYFKREAIRWAWELLVGRWDLEPDRLYATVHAGDERLGLEPDEEAAALWQEETSIEPGHVLYGSTKDNFWMMGETGPCGPCSEIHVDLRSDEERARVPGRDLVNADDPRVLEIWNLVFIQYDARPDGTLVPLPHKHVDTGMGLERITAVLQGKGNDDYATDLFAPIVERVRELRGHSKAEMEADPVPYRVLADHGRAMAFLLAEGVVPGNDKHRYVLRMIMRRALRYGHKLGLKPPFLAEVGAAVIATLGEVFPELEEHRAAILKWAEQEEKLFGRTLERGLEHLEACVQRLRRQGRTVIPGEEAFYLHDTLGFPIEVTEDLARERGLGVDREGFQRQMRRQKERSRRGSAARVTAPRGDGARSDLPATVFSGYECLEDEGKVLALLADEERRPALEAKASGWLVLDRTPFYAEGGGQVADTGLVEGPAGRARVEAVRREAGIFLHRVRVLAGSLRLGERCRLRVDVERRQAVQRHHTATHLLHAALHRVVGEHAVQAGSRVAPEELRFDFAHFEPLTAEQIAQIEDLVNGVILEDLPVEITEVPLAQAKAQGAMALFAEDYRDKERVRMVSVLEPDGTAFSRELCGGTHVARTGEIGLFKVLSEESAAAGVRRVHAAAGTALLGYLREREALLERAAARLGTVPAELADRLDALLAERRALKQQLASWQQAQAASQVERLLTQKEAFDGFEGVVARTDLEGEALKALADRLENALQPGVVVLGSAVEGRVQLVCKVSRSLTERVKAGEIIKALSPLVGGGGGGAPGFAQGGGSRPEGLDEALAEARALLARLAS